MDRGCHSSESSSTATTSASTGNNGGSDAFLKNLNKISHKISKPVRRPPVFENQSLLSSQLINEIAAQPAAAQNLQPPPPQQQQPPVYNINKSDFRDVVQKLTGSPAHERMATPPPIQQPKPPSSRLQRIRPPPLAQIGNRPPPPPLPLMNVAGGSPFQHLPTANQVPVGGGFIGDQRHVQAQPPSPLPPFPAVHGAAESPISAYMRFLRGAATGLSPLAPLESPRWHGPAPPQPPLPPPQSSSAPPVPQFQTFPSPPLPFGCLPSPRSPYGLLSPSLLLSPSGQLGFQQLPLSPTVPSPTWKGI